MPVQIRSAVSCPRCRFRRYREDTARAVLSTPGLRHCQVCGEERMNVYDMERGGVLCLECPPNCPLRPRTPPTGTSLTPAEIETARRMVCEALNPSSEEDRRCTA